MTGFKSAALFIGLGVLLASLAGSPQAAPDKTLGMALMSAAVNGDDGALLSGAGAAGAERTDEGVYRVTFKRSLVGCNHVVSVSGFGGVFQVSPRRVIHSTAPAGPQTAPNVVVVRTTTSVGDFALDTNFQVIVFCPA